MERCVVGQQGGAHSHGAESQRPLGGGVAQSLQQGSVVTQHRGCKPTCRVSVPQFMLGCAGGVAAALVVVRWRQRRAAF